MILGFLAAKLDIYAAVSKSSILPIPRSVHHLANLSKSSRPIFLARFHNSESNLSTVGIPEGADAPALYRLKNSLDLFNY